MANIKQSSLFLRPRLPSISVQIVFPQDEVDGFKYEPVRREGEELSGELRVSLRAGTNFAVDVAFEGYIRTWIPEYCSDPFTTSARSVGQTKFLEEMQTLLSVNTRGSGGSEDSANAITSEESDLITVHLPFSFKVPHRLISAQGDVADEFLDLPPSTKLGQGYTGPCGGLRYGQPNITYSVRVLRVLTAVPPDLLACNNWSAFTCSDREITIRPSVTPGPPVEVAHFPNEYNVQAAVTLRRLHPLYRPGKLGILTAAAAEPIPMNPFIHASDRQCEGKVGAIRPSTTAYLALTFVPCGSDPAAVPTTTWTIAVTHFVRSRTFFSTRPMTQAPTHQVAKEKKGIMRFTDRKTKPETHEYRLDASNWSQSVDGWRFTLPVCVSAAQATLVPTFLNQLAARRYAVVLRVEVKEMRHRALELILPLQVISCASDTSDSEDWIHAPDVADAFSSNSVDVDGGIARAIFGAPSPLISPPAYKAGTYF